MFEDHIRVSGLLYTKNHCVQLCTNPYFIESSETL